MPWSEVCRVIGKRRLPLPPFLTNWAAEPLRMTRVVDLPPEVLDLLRYGRVVDTRAYRRAGFEYRYTTAATVNAFARSLRLELSPEDGTFHIRSRERLSEDEWTVNAVGRLLGEPTTAAAPVVPPLAEGDERIVLEAERHYHLTEAVGLDYGPYFRGLGRIERQGRLLRAELATPAAVAAEAAGYILHPALLDLCFQALVDYFQPEIESGSGLPYLPIKIGNLRCFSGEAVTSFRARLKHYSRRSVVADFDLLDREGTLVARMVDCRFRAAPLQRRAHKDPAAWRIVPHPQPRPEDARVAPVPPLAPERSSSCAAAPRRRRGGRSAT